MLLASCSAFSRALSSRAAIIVFAQAPTTDSQLPRATHTQIDDPRVALVFYLGASEASTPYTDWCRNSRRQCRWSSRSLGRAGRARAHEQALRKAYIAAYAESNDIVFAHRHRHCQREGEGRGECLFLLVWRCGVAKESRYKRARNKRDRHTKRALHICARAGAIRDWGWRKAVRASSILVPTPNAKDLGPSTGW